MWRPAERGFTLLEVLAAVAVLGIVYTVLTSASMQGLRALGDADRRTRASLVADSALAALEAQVLAGVTPAPGEFEETQDGFLVRVGVEPYTLPPLPLEDVPEALAPEEPVLLAPPRGGRPSPLRTIHLTVSWTEGGGEQSVSRTTFALDRAAVAELAPSDAGPDERTPDAGDLGGQR